MKDETQHSTTTKQVVNEKSSKLRAHIKGAKPQQWWGIAALFLAITGTVYTVLTVQQSLAFGTTKLPTIAELNRGVTIYDRNDKYVCTLRADADRQAVPIAKISPHMRNAIVAAEDRRYFSHHGVDPQGILRAFFKNQRAGRIVEGGSTITQQLVKNLYCDKTDRSYNRKIKEARMAIDLDMRYSKNKILETYLNVVYFGGGVCGVERAAQHYFNKPAANLNPSESAWLAALVKAPSDLSVTSSAKALARQKEILAAMGECGFLSPAMVKQAGKTKLAFKNGPLSRPWPHYIGCVEEVLQDQLGEDLWKGGWKVYTNLDVSAQKLAESTVNAGIKAAPRGIDQGALVTMSLKDAAVIAIVGGAGAYKDVQWNRAIHPHTAGSTFKPFVYFAALTRGLIQPDTIIDDSPVEIAMPDEKPYEPKNFDGRFKGWMPARTALATSRNVCSVRVAQATGLAHVIEIAHAAGIRSQLDAYPSLALGSCAISPMDMTTAYATLARGGIYLAPQLVRRIDTEAGKTYRTYQATPSSNLASEPTLQLLDVLQDVVRCGTGTRARIPGVAVAGKTGTSNDSKDIWFVGFTPDTITTVWAGNDLHKPVRGIRVTGGVVMAKVWHDYMSVFLKDHRPQQIAFAKPEKPLIAEMPEYADNQLFYEQVNANMESNQPQLDAARLASQVTNVPDLEKASTAGIGRAFDIQKLAAIKRLTSTTIASSNGDGVSNNGVTNYSYSQSGSYAVRPGSQNAYSQNANSSQAPTAVATSAWNSVRRRPINSYVMQPGSNARQIDATNTEAGIGDGGANAHPSRYLSSSLPADAGHDQSIADQTEVADGGVIYVR